MEEYVVVNSKEELERAVERETRQIIITNPELAKNITIVKTLSTVAFAGVVGAAGVAVTNFWNPVGWGVGAFGLVAGGSSLTAVIAIGVGVVVLYSIYNDYSIETRVRVKTPDGTEYEADVVLNRK